VNSINNYKKYIVALIDIVGFKNMIDKTYTDENMFSRIHEALSRFTALKSREAWENAKILMDIEEDAQKKTLDDFYIENMVHCACFSDCVIIAVEANDKIDERVSAIIALLAQISADLLRQGIFIRGAMTYGDLFIEQNADIYFGKALNHAHELETKIAKYPRIVLSNDLIAKLNYPLLAKYNRFPYYQYIERFTDGTVGFSPLIYFQVMQSAPDIFSEQELKSALNEVKNNIIFELNKNFENPYIFEKYAWLKDQYNDLIILDFELSKILEPDTIHGYKIHYYTKENH